jgi:hypothetical protein
MKEIFSVMAKYTFIFNKELTFFKYNIMED